MSSVSFHSAVTNELTNTESGDMSLVTVGIRSIHMALSIVYRSTQRKGEAKEKINEFMETFI